MGTAAGFLHAIRDLDGLKRERLIVSAFRLGLHPSWMFGWQRVAVRRGGRVLEYEVTPSYLAIGDDAAWLRVPMQPLTAQLLADAHDAMLPTPQMVDDIYRAADVKLPALPLTTDRGSSATYAAHNAAVEARRGNKPVGVLAAGEKKDVVLANGLAGRPDRVAIYGWHGLTGRPLQPVYCGHARGYVDYSHGVRLVRRRARLDGAMVDLGEVATDRATCALVQHDGPLRVLRYAAG